MSYWWWVRLRFYSKLRITRSQVDWLKNSSYDNSIYTISSYTEFTVLWNWVPRIVLYNVNYVLGYNVQTNPDIMNPISRIMNKILPGGSRTLFSSTSHILMKSHQGGHRLEKPWQVNFQRRGLKRLQSSAVQAFVDILDATIESIPVNVENVEDKQTYLGSVIHSSTSCEPKIDWEYELVAPWIQ